MVRADRRKSDRPLSYAGQAMLYCVRLKDGYYFPAPNAQFVNAGHYDNTLDRCRYICNDKAMDVYELDDIGRETEEMASVGTRQSYRDLPSAFAYREMADSHGCDLPRYIAAPARCGRADGNPKEYGGGGDPAAASQARTVSRRYRHRFRTRSAGDDAQGPHRRGAVPAELEEGRFASAFSR
ncbi:DUF2865 domain-containing protein [Aminobacter sp. BA135]|uniref:DUF2865 domain-containing protein n=1 Tax=Aminobacter sp. BA135 TaxID=537596 RepID=UPI003D7B1483